MATYTGVADANGDFTIPFSQNYTGGQKVTVKASKDGAEKTIELYAPSDTTGGGVIQFSGTMNNFPTNIGVITLSSEISGSLPAYCFATANALTCMYENATGLNILGSVTVVGTYCFNGWKKAQSLSLPSSLTNIGSSAFYNWNALKAINIPNSVTLLGTSAFRMASAALTINTGNGVQILQESCFQDCSACTSITIGSSVNNIQQNSLSGFSSCNEMILLPTTPPTLNASAMQNLKSTCVFKVPSASLNAYKTAPVWVNYASRIIGV